jgi:hypothetical protein
LGDFLNKLIWSPYQLNIPHFCSWNYFFLS